MMTVRDLKDILVHFDREDDDYEVVLWDYNHQQELEWGGGHASSKDDRTLVFSVGVPDVDGETINTRIRKLVDEYYKTKDEAEQK